MVVSHERKKASLKEIFFTVAGIAFVFFLPHFGLFPFSFSYTIPVLLGVWLLLRRTGENFANLGFSFKRFEIRSLFIGALAAILLFIFLRYIFFPVLYRFNILEHANLQDFKHIRHNTGGYIFVLIAGFVVGGFYEELVFHGFIFTRLEKILPVRFAFFMSFLIANLIFAIYHFQQGPAGVLNAFLAGCAYHALMLRFNRNLWYSFFFHGFFDAIALTYIYLGYR